MSEPLSEAEVCALPEGTPVVVTWSGGNGPHRYVIAVDKYGERFAWDGDGKSERMRWYNPLRFVGRGAFHTRVWLAAPTPPSAAERGAAGTPGSPDGTESAQDDSRRNGDPL